MTIIQYQNVTFDSNLSRLWLSCGSFKKQIQYLLSNDFQVLSIDNAIDYIKKLKEVKGRPISLTFDNGFFDFYEHVFPILQEYHLPSTLLISPDKVGVEKPFGRNSVRYLSWPALRELSENGVTIGAYDDSSWNINEIPEDKVLKRIKEYKRIFADRLGIRISHFGVKEGVPSHKIRDRLQAEGYRAFLTECPTNGKTDLFAIGRVQVDDDDFNIFLTKISRTYLFFKDKKSWKYIREYSLDKVAHKISETFDRLRGIKGQ